jgi:hypothetical protein
MQPADTCNTFLGREKLETILASLSSPQIKAILRTGNLRTKVPGGLVSNQKRKKLWISRISEAIRDDNDDAASEFLQQWLLNHRRAMLIDYLDRMGVSHRAGETETSFLLVNDADKARQCASVLLQGYPPDEAATYLIYVAHQQKATVFDDWEPLLRLRADHSALPSQSTGE